VIAMREVRIARNEDYEGAVRTSFAQQKFMATLGARLVHVAPGEVDITIEHRDELTQQHGFLHAGVLGSILDSACGYAAYSLMPANAGVLSIEYKLNLLEPARGTSFVARGRVIRAGRTITTCRGEAFAGGGSRPIAILLASMMTLQDRAGIRG
jgi:uncharacterized protein (TIGR00369 family)